MTKEEWEKLTKDEQEARYDQVIKVMQEISTRLKERRENLEKNIRTRNCKI